MMKILYEPGSGPFVQANAIVCPFGLQDGFATYPSPLVTLSGFDPSMFMRQSCSIPLRPEMNSTSCPFGFTSGETSDARTWEIWFMFPPLTSAMQMFSQPLMLAAYRMCLLSGVNPAV